MFNRKRAVTAGAWAPPDYNGRPVAAPGVEGSDAWFRDLQDRMWQFCHTEGLARFSTAFVADAGARCDLVPARYVDGVGWSTDFDAPETKQYADQAQKVARLIERIRGRYTDQSRTVWTLLWQKRSAGEVYVAIEASSEFGVTFTPYSYKSCKLTKSPEGFPVYSLHDRPGDTKGRQIAPESILRFWTSHPDWPAMPYSPLWAGLKDLERFKLLGKVMNRGANSALLARGALWFPAEAMDETVMVNGKAQPKLLTDYYASAQQTMESPDDDYKALTPFALYWDSDLGKPERVEFKIPFGDEWMNARGAAITDFARSVDLPSVIVMNGGAGGGGEGGGSNNHWSDLLVDRRTFDMTVGSELDALCHEDLTRYILTPQLATKTDIVGWPGQDEYRLWRIEADPTRLIVNQDRSLQAMDAYRFGVINLAACLKRLGFRRDEIAGKEDWKRLAEMVTRSAQSQDMTRFRQRALTSDNGGSGAQVQLPNGATGSADLPSADDLIQWLDA